MWAGGESLRLKVNWPVERPRIVRTSATTEVRPTLGLVLQESGGVAGAKFFVLTDID